MISAPLAFLFFALSLLFGAATVAIAWRNSARADEEVAARIDALLAGLDEIPPPPLVVEAPPEMVEGQHVVGVVKDGRVLWITEQDPAVEKPERLH